MSLLTYENTKTVKGVKYGVRTAVLHLMPGSPQICPCATET